MKQNMNANTSPKGRSTGTEHASSHPAERTKPTLKPWMHRIFEGAGVEIPPEGVERDRLAWQGVEMQRFLGFSRTMPAGTSLPDALEAYGRQLKERTPALEDWRIDRTREALRIFRRGSENWEILDGEGGIEVKFRTKATRSEAPPVGNPA